MPDLYAYQHIAVQWLRQRSKAILALDQGLGKTAVSATEAIAPVFVICPATLKINWAREFAMWRPELKVNVISKASETADLTADVNVINYDIVGKVTPPPFTTLICDESHYLKSPTAKRTKFCVALIKHASRVRLLSGTPVVNRPIELYATLRAIGGTKLDYINFGRRYCAGWQTPWGSFDVSGASNIEELYGTLKEYLYRVTKATALPELPEKTYRIIEFDISLSPKEKQLIKTAIAKPDHPIPFEAIPDIMKLNAQKKLPLAIEHIRTVLQHEQKVVVFAWHSATIDALQDALAEYGCVKVVGGMSHKDRQASVDEFQSGAARVFLGNTKAAGVGLTLTAANYVIFVETPWAPADLHQAADRCHRIGQKNHVQVDVLTLEKSIDSMQLHAILGKTTIVNNLIKENVVNHSELKSRIDAIAHELTLLSQQIENESMPAPAPAPAPTTDAKSKSKSKPKEITIDDVRSIVREILANDESKGMIKVKTVLDQFQATRLSDLSASKYSDFLSALSN